MGGHLHADGPTLVNFIIVYGFAAFHCPCNTFAHASRLPEHVRRKLGTISLLAVASWRCAPPAHTAADALCRRQRARVAGTIFPSRLSPRLRGGQRIPFPDFQWHYSEVDPPRTGNTHGRLRRHDGRVDGRDHGHDRGFCVAARRLLRGQQPRWYCGAGARSGRDHDQFLGIPGDCRPDGFSRALCRRADAPSHRRRARFAVGMAHIFQTVLADRP
jgi:hypothetical protein